MENKATPRAGSCSRRGFLRAASTVATGLAWQRLAGRAEAAAPASEVTGRRRPNIVFFYCDDQAAWTLGGSGHPQAHTPHLDRLAREGARFSNLFTTTPVCSPARGSCMTSRYGTELGILDFITDPGHKAYTDEVGAIGLSNELPTFAGALAQAGYTTGLVGKWHLGDWTRDPQRRFHPTRFGFQHFMGMTGGGIATIDPELEIGGEVKPCAGLTGDILTREAIGFIERNHARPFLLMVGLRSPHAKWLPVAEADAAPYRGVDLTIPNPDYPDLDVANVKRMMGEYLSSVTGVDRNVGEVLATLDRLGLTDDTIVIHSADHGYNMGHNGIWHKGNGIWATKSHPPDSPNISGKYRPNLYDHSLRVPGLVRWPGVVRPGSVLPQVCSCLDWLPTLVDLAGTSLPTGATVRGRSLVPLLRAKAPADWPTEFYAEYSMRVYCRTDLRAIRTPEWKLVRDFLNPGRDELYHLSVDPEESQNLIGQSSTRWREVTKTLDARIADHLRRLGDPLLARIRHG